jgi:hypothetical protein
MQKLITNFETVFFLCIGSSTPIRVIDRNKNCCRKFINFFETGYCELIVLTNTLANFEVC